MKKTVLIAGIVVICLAVGVAVSARGGGIPLIQKPCTKGSCALSAY